MPSKIVIPTITPYSLDKVITEANLYLNYYNTIHFDVIDKSYGEPTYLNIVEVLEALKGYKKVVMHLMVENPTSFILSNIADFKNQKLLFILPNKKVSILNIQALVKQQISVGLAFELGEDFYINTDTILNLNELMFLPITPGKTGNIPDLSFLVKMEAFLDKNLSNLTNKLTISIDGGFSLNNYTEYLQTKATVIYANTFFKNKPLNQVIQDLRNINAYENTNLIHQQ